MSDSTIPSNAAPSGAPAEKINWRVQIAWGAASTVLGIALERILRQMGLSRDLALFFGYFTLFLGLDVGMIRARGRSFTRRMIAPLVGIAAIAAFVLAALMYMSGT